MKFKRIKRIIVLAVCLSIIGASTIATASATDIDTSTSTRNLDVIGVEFTHGESHAVKPASEELLEATSLDEIAEISLRNFEESQFSSDATISEVAAGFEDYHKAVELLTEELSEPMVVSDDGISQTGLIEYMCYADGIAVYELAFGKFDADDALKEAQKLYPNDPENMQDTYRHFTWNFRLTKHISQTKARTITCNYEWEAILRPYALSAYNKYITNGDDSTTAVAKAYQYAYYMREDCYSVCAAGVDYFTAIFKKAAIRDFWNNCYGRAFAADYTSRSDAFNAANKAGNLINSDDAVTNTHIHNVWSWDWYTA